MVAVLISSSIPQTWAALLQGHACLCSGQEPAGRGGVPASQACHW